MSANVHGLLHLPDVVKNLGPLWSHSCFPFESANGQILKLFHGSQGVEKQVQVHPWHRMCGVQTILCTRGCVIYV